MKSEEMKLVGSWQSAVKIEYMAVFSLQSAELKESA